MPRSVACTLLLALALLGCTSLSSGARLPEANKDAALDAAFLQSWLHLDSGSAAKLASEGSAAATTRRELMAAASTTGTLGTQLTGAYETGTVISFVATLPTLTTGTFGASRQKSFTDAVKELANKAMGATSAAQQSVPTVEITLGNSAAGLKVTTRVTFPVGRPGAAQVFYSYISVNPGSSASWLSSIFQRATVGAPSSSKPRCADPLCQQCTVIGIGTCDKCVPTAGAGNTAVSVYRAVSGACTKCTVANCDTCSMTGACALCKPDFTTLRGTCKRKCSSSLCENCPNSATVCTKCKAFVSKTTPRRSIFLQKGVCKACNAANCAVCNTNGTCKTCRFNHAKNLSGVCACTLRNCQSCPGLISCAKCRAGYIQVNGQCAKCRVTGCAVCAINNVNRCATCAKGYKFVNGKCPGA